MIYFLTLNIFQVEITHMTF